MDLREILESSHVIAVVGLSPDRSRTSNWVASYMQSRGYKIVPVNPKMAGKEILGERVYSNLTGIPFDIDIVNIFRRSEFVYPHVEEAVKRGVKVIWMQLGIYNEKAAELAKSNGIEVVMNMCIATTHSAIFGV